MNKCHLIDNAPFVVFWLQGEMIVKEARANLSMWNPLKDLIIKVCILSSAGCGPWSEPLLLTSQDLIGKWQMQEAFLFAFEENGLLLIWCIR